MRYLVIRAIAQPQGNINFEGLARLTHTPSGVVATWVNLREAKTNCLKPEQCDLLSFEDPDELEQNIELWNVGETVGIVGVDAPTTEINALNE